MLSTDEFTRSGRIILFCWLLSCTAGRLYAEQPRYVEPNQQIGVSAAVVVGDRPLVHTPQILPFDEKPPPTPTDPAVQIESMLDGIDKTLTDADSGLQRIVKLNVYVARSEFIDDVHRQLAVRFSGTAKPAVSFVVTRLPNPDTVVAADAVATTSRDPGRAVQMAGAQESDRGIRSQSAVIPSGTRIYVSGQADRNESLVEATRGTLESLSSTLRHLGRRHADIVQLKAFLQPMSDVAVVEREIDSFFGEQPVPPVVFVEWKSAAAVPIEIELIAWGGMNRSGDVVEYLTPPGMKPSPVFSRVTRINHSRSIYFSDVYAKAGLQDGPTEVRDVFNSLEDFLKQTGSDLRHLVKATYYVSGEEASRSLNELRPEYYDAARPPAASKAMVADVGRAGRGLTLDMIAVPAIGDSRSEYGPPEYGHGLSADDAQQGWISLFDGKTTFGWQDADVVDGILFGGVTTTEIGRCELQADFAGGGSIQIAGRQVQVPTGRFQWTPAEDSSSRQPDSNAVGPIRLGEGVEVRHLAVRPLGLASLFNSNDLSGWRRIDREDIPTEQRPVWSVDDGILHAIGGPGCVEYEGRRFGDFVLQLDARTNRRHANGGVFFRAIPGDFMNGYEAQVFNRSENGDPSRPARWSTGGIDDRMNARRMVSRDGEFFRMTVIARARHIATWVNGHQQVDWIDAREPDSNPREGLRLEPGAIQLQAHDPGTDVEFRRIEAAAW